MTWNIHWRLFFYLCLGFIAATIIGTLSHEFGHFLVARSMGFDPRINYAMTWLTESGSARTMTDREAFLFTLGGPLQTLLTGTTGLVLLVLFRRSFFAVERLSFGQWLVIFLSLFWLRQVANLVGWLVNYLRTGQFTRRADEIKLSETLHLPLGFLLVITAMIGAIISAIVIFKFIPLHQRFTFILSGLVGGVVGFALWMGILGEMIMP
jgi:hypothetical protein